MSSQRFFIVREKPSTGDIIDLGAEESRHLAKVVRARPGDEVTLLDGRGGIYRAAVVDVERGSVSVKIADVSDAGPPFPADLAVPVIKASRMDYAVEKCAEIGIRRILPFSSQRSIWRGAEADALRKQGRLERKVEAACKQSGNPWLTAIDPVRSLEELIALFERYDRVLVASSDGRSCVEIETGRGGSALGIIGPEGGLTYDERESLRKAGAMPVSLGRTRLRSETAASCLAWFMISTG